MTPGFTDRGVMTVRNLPLFLVIGCLLFGCSTATSSDMPPETPAPPPPKTISSMDCKELDEKMANEYRMVGEFEIMMSKVNVPPPGKTMEDVKKTNAENKAQFIDPRVKDYYEAQKEYKSRCKGEATATKAAQKLHRTKFIR
jgi:hypothetical protein